ncbi:MAG: flagellar biosynthetic protein FliR [Myxococcales bacterium]|jgi:flagellar biosynthetic protein FliR
MSGAPLSAQELSRALAVAFLLAARMAPVATLVPFVAPRAPGPLAPALTLVLVAALLPVALASAPVLPASLLVLSALSLRELLLGLVYALSLSMLLLPLRWAGAFIGRATGAAGHGVSDGSLATLLLWGGVVAFFALGGHRLTIAVLADGLLSAPVGALSAPTDAAGLALGAARLFGDALSAAVLIALPVLAALLLAELGVGLSMRLASSVTSAAVVQSARPALALTVLLLSAAMLMARLPEAFRQGLQAASRLWRLL